MPIYLGNILIGTENYLGNITIPESGIFTYQAGWVSVIASDCSSTITGVTFYISDADWSNYSLGFLSVVYFPSAPFGAKCWQITSIGSSGTTPQTITAVGAAYGTSCSTCQAANP